ncbi:hypothetical protein Hanom_Chr11g01044121 [Helianthus anomalus]
MLTLRILPHTSFPCLSTLVPRNQFITRLDSMTRVIIILVMILRGVTHLEDCRYDLVEDLKLSALRRQPKRVGNFLALLACW